MRNINSILNVPELKITDLQNFDYLYHGTYSDNGTCDFKDKTKIDLSKGKKVVDFGQGFYLTPDFKQAKKRAISVFNDKRTKRGESSSDKLKNIFINKVPTKNNNSTEIEKPIVIKYPTQLKSIDDTVKLLILAKPDIEWFKFVFNNRKKKPDITLLHNHDFKFELVFGYMADGLFKNIIRLLKRDFEELNNEEINFIYCTFVKKENRIETQVSIHNNNVLNNYILNGEIIELR